ncbi:cytidine deaminase [Mobilicoccus caccae]|uniref:Cytidine deaminase n=1 Tax=Mobilicoccus caccae TaxID=1859295 RepID=A0ABQ6IS80_9MICO|nr:cytidine deaminase [Mobilicoccus caccae]GMA39916.1 cytidine deaminase [Mobilicoccus caccae]
MTTPPPASTASPAPPDDAQLLRLAHEAADRAYVPYSRFPVGAALLTRSGRIVLGCNVENASYGLTICAERTGATRMIAESGDADDRRIVKVAVVGTKASPCFPCGACRQVLHEFGCEEVVVEIDGAPRSYPFAEILPHGFGPADLEPTTGSEA